MTAKRKITDKNGVQVYPITHTKAVIDDNGNSVEQRLEEQMDVINQKQLEVGAVPSDITPTKGSTNWVTSGGVWREIDKINNDTYRVKDVLGHKTTDLVELDNFTSKCYYNDSFEELTDRTAAHSNDINIEGMEYIIISLSKNTATSATNRRCFFIDSNRQLIGNAFYFDYHAGDYQFSIPENAVYFVFNTVQSYLTNNDIPISVVAYKSGSIDILESSVKDNKEAISDINIGYGNLLKYGWKRGGWYSYNSFRTDLYRNVASIPEIIYFDKDTTLTLQKGFRFQLYGRRIDDTSFSASGCTITILAGSSVCIGVKRINPISDEILTPEQIQEFASAVMVTSMRGSDRELTKNTFFGIEMYETMAIIGDSYSAGNNGNNWGKCLGRMIGTAITVWAQSGLTSSEWVAQKLQTLLSSDPKDLYWINLGINDGARVKLDPTYLGSRADLNEETYRDLDFPDTFYGNIGKIIRNIQVHAPNAKIILEKTMFASMENAQQNIGTTNLLDINNAIIDLSEYYGLPCIDQLDDPFYCSPEFRASITSNHPRKYAWVGMANANRRLFTSAVFKNPEYFY